MFNLLLALITGVVIGWNFHSFFLQLNPPNILKNDINISTIKEEQPIKKVEIVSKPIAKPAEIKQPIQTVNNETSPKIIPKEDNSSKKSIPMADNFYTLLENNLFSDAMALYIDAKETKLSLYKATLIDYFEKKIKTNPQMAIEQMLELHELEPKSVKVNEEQLHDIEYHDNQVEQATLLLNLIKNKTKKQDYQHHIPLQKVGEHFTLKVQINDSDVTLLLDTGATLTMVDEAKLPILTMLKENIVLNTAGGKINAQLQEAENFSIGDVKLEKFEIVSSSFEQEHADGLLGMNFFKKFNFKIDQEKSLLYLSKKSNTKEET